MRKNIILLTVALAVTPIIGLTGCSTTEETSDQIVEKLTENQKLAINESLKADVSNTVVAINTYLTTNPTDPKIDGDVPLTPSDENTHLTINGGWDTYKVTGYNVKTGYTYVFDSTTGKYTGSN